MWDFCFVHICQNLFLQKKMCTSFTVEQNTVYLFNNTFYLCFYSNCHCQNTSYLDTFKVIS